MAARDEEVREMARAVREFVAMKLAPIIARLDALEANQKTLADFYRGKFILGESYQRGDVATDRGGAWICLHPTTARPGKTADWRLIAKGD